MRRDIAMRERYINVMERALEAYSAEKLNAIISDAETNGVREHGFFRIVSVMGILLSNGRRAELLPLFRRGMDIACDAIWKTDMTIPENKGVGIDFAVKEIVFAYIELENSGLFPVEWLERWFDGIKSVDWRKNYSAVAHFPEERLNNWGMYNAAGEYMREYIGAADAEEYLDIQLASQVLALDENGMYRDPGCPMLYDLASRAQFAVMLHFGYCGKWKETLDEALRKAGKLTLYMQSANGEIPFGGRSNRFLFNEAYLAAVCEFEASRYKKKGNTELSGQFKAASLSALESIERRLSQSPVKHIRNGFPQNSSFGLEDYAYFDKYMVSLASFIYLAYLFADDDIRPLACLSETGGFVSRTSPDFHKITAAAGGYSAEIDTKADLHYDATGLGRIQFAGAPSELILSEPFPEKPTYSIADDSSAGMLERIRTHGENPSFLSLSPVVRFEDGNETGIAELSESVLCGLEIIEQSPEKTEFKIVWQSAETGKISEHFLIDASGVEIRAEADIPKGAELIRYVPVIETDGSEKSDTENTEKLVTVKYRGAKLCIYGENFEPSDKKYANRDGIYRAFVCSGERIKFKAN